MNYCSKCGNKIINNETNCINCNINLKENIYTEIIVPKNENNAKKKKGMAIISLILALIPLLLILYCQISSGGSGDESRDGAVWWLILIYYATVGIPISIFSLFFGIASFIKNKNGLALISIFVDLLPYIIFILLLII